MGFFNSVGVQPLIKSLLREMGCALRLNCLSSGTEFQEQSDFIVENFHKIVIFRRGGGAGKILRKMGWRGGQGGGSHEGGEKHGPTVVAVTPVRTKKQSY